jgi:hypothetical protein
VVLETVEVRRLGGYLNLSRNVRETLRQQCFDDVERRNELISWWLQYSPYALDSWNWLSGQFLYWEEESALAAARRFINQAPGMTVLRRYKSMHAMPRVYNIYL